MFDLSNYSKYFDDSNKLVVGKIKDENLVLLLKDLLDLSQRFISFW